MSFGTAQPHIASYLLLKKDGKVAFVLRQNTNWMNGHYGLVAGKVEQNESYVAAAIREGKEESGVDLKEDRLRHVLTVHRNDSESDIHFWVDVYFEATEWGGEAHNAEPNVHSELAWLDPDNLPENVIPSVRFALEQIKAGKTYAEYGWRN